MNDAPQRPLFHKISAVLLFAFAIYSVFSIRISETLMVLLCLAWLLNPALWRGAKRVRLPLLWPLTAFLALSIVASLLSVEPLTALNDIGSELWMPVFFIACVNLIDTRESAALLTRMLVLAGTVSALSGLAQLFFNGFDFRIQGTLGHYMTLAGVLLSVLLLALAQLLLNGTTRRAIWVAPAVICFAGLLATQTRGAWLGLLAGLAVLVWFWKKRFLLALPLVALLIWFAAPEGAQRRISDMLTLQDATTVERLYMWRSGSAIVRDNPLIGVGPDLVLSVYPDYKLPDDPWLAERKLTHLHSNPVQLAAERGLPALACWLGIWVVFGIYVRKAFTEATVLELELRALAVGALACVVAFLVAGLFEYNYGDSEVLHLIFFIMALYLGPLLSGSRAVEGR